MRSDRKTILSRLSMPEQRLFKAMRYGCEIHIDDLFKVLWPNLDQDMPLRDKHMRVGSCVSSANQKLGYHDLRISPGVKRRTYVLRTTITFAR